MSPDRTALLAEADQLLHRSVFSKEDGARVTQLLALADSLVDRTDIRRATLARHAAELGKPDPFADRASKEQIDREAGASFSAYLRGSPEIRAAQGVGVGTSGGYLVPAPFADRFEVMLQATDELFSLATLFSTATGAPTNFPLVDDVSQSAAIVAENAGPSTESDTPFGAVAFGQCPTWRSGGYVLASLELAQDSKFPLEALTAAAFGVRFGRGVGKAFVTTLLAAAGNGGTTASPIAIAADEVWSLAESLDAAYLQNASFLMMRSTYAALMKLKGTSGNYMFHPAFNAAGRPILCGNYPVYFSPSMGALTASQQPITFGDHSKFIRREVRDSLQIRTLTQKFALLGQIAYIGFLRVDGGLPQGAAGHPIPVNALTMAAS